MPAQREIEAVSDCPRLVAAPVPSPPIAEPDRSQPAGMWSDGRRFGLLAPTTLDKSQLHHAVRPEGSLQDSPLDINDPRTRAYFDEIKRRIFAVWSYPKAAAQQNQSGSGEVVFMVKQDGRIGTVDVVRSTGSAVLDQYMANAIRLAAPFSPFPCKITEEAIPVTLSFEYVLRNPPRGFQP
jgi:TonB family protein